MASSADLDELTPEQAAKILGMSQVLVMQRVRAGKLPYRRANTQYRFKASDVLKLKREEDTRRAALRELADHDNDLARKHGV